VTLVEDRRSSTVASLTGDGGTVRMHPVLGSGDLRSARGTSGSGRPRDALVVVPCLLLGLGGSSCGGAGGVPQGDAQIVDSRADQGGEQGEGGGGEIAGDTGVDGEGGVDVADDAGGEGGAEAGDDAGAEGGGDGWSCEELRARFRAELATVRRCTEDVECMPHAFPVPGLAYCYTGVNRAADLTAADRAAADLRSAGCETREYDCEPEPPAEAVCRPTGECLLIGEEYARCEPLRLAFIDEVERLARCESDGDCALVVVRNCGVMAACWIAIHRDADQTRLRDIEHEYGVVLCPYRTCSCPLPTSIECAGGRCVDRYD
jgi:hypothetical protein